MSRARLQHIWIVWIECQTGWPFFVRLCNGRRKIEEIVPLLSANLPEIEECSREYVCVRLLAGAQAENLIDIVPKCFYCQTQALFARGRIGSTQELTRISENALT